jgi:hypothetical protein
MVLTKDERIELLKKAREAKKVKAEERKKLKAENPPKKGRPPKVKEEQKTLDLTESSTDAPPVEKDDVFEIEEIVETRKVKKPKKIVRKRIIQEYESGTDEEEEIIEEVPIRRARPPQAKAKPVERPVELQKPREVDITQSTSQFNFFGY